MRPKNFPKRPSIMPRRPSYMQKIKKTAKWMKDIKKLLRIKNMKKILRIMKTAFVILDAFKIFVSSIT